MEKGTSVALPWYETPESYQTVLAMLPDEEKEGPLSYEDFLSKIRGHELRLKNDGQIPCRIPIDPIGLKDFCDVNKLRVCRASIQEYCMIAVGLMVRSRQRNN